MTLSRKKKKTPNNKKEGKKTPKQMYNYLKVDWIGCQLAIKHSGAFCEFVVS